MIWRNHRLLVRREKHVCHYNIHRLSSLYHIVEQSNVVVVVDFVVVGVVVVVVDFVDWIVVDFVDWIVVDFVDWIVVDFVADPS
jgi:hypothetical protein